MPRELARRSADQDGRSALLLLAATKEEHSVEVILVARVLPRWPRMPRARGAVVFVRSVILLAVPTTVALRQKGVELLLSRAFKRRHAMRGPRSQDVGDSIVHV